MRNLERAISGGTSPAGQRSADRFLADRLLAARPLAGFRTYAHKTAVLGTALFAMGTMSFAQGGGQATYKAKCQMCHGATGAGDTPAGKAMKTKPFNDPEVARMSDAALMGIVKNGQGKMRAFKDILTDAQIKDVIAYMHGLEKSK